MLSFLGQIGFFYDELPLEIPLNLLLLVIELFLKVSLLSCLDSASFLSLFFES